MVLRNVQKSFSLEEQRQEINLLAQDVYTLANTAETDPVFVGSPAANITSLQISNWDVAYGWGNHNAAGYLTAETDPLFYASPAANITNTLILNWNAAYSWGDHSQAGYAPGANVSNWDAAYSWGDHNAVGYLTAESDTLAAVVSRGNTTGGDITFDDNDVLKIGTNNDLSLYFDGTPGIQTSFIDSDQLIIRPKTQQGDAYITGIQGGPVQLYYGTNTRLSTSSTGVDIIGDLTVSGSVNIDIGDLQNVDAPFPTAGQVLKYNGTNWAPASDLTGGGSGGGGISLTDLSVSVTSPGTPNLTYDNISGTFFYTPPITSNYLTIASSINDLSDVDTTTSSVGNVLKWDGSNWSPGTEFISSISDIGDVNAPNPAVGQVLKWDGSTWSPASDLTGGGGGGGGGIGLADLSAGSNLTASGDGGLTYDNATGTFRYFPPDLSPYLQATAGDKFNWTVAYNWGDHSQAGYLTSFTETDPIYSASAAATITSPKISNWDAAHSWGDHGAQGYLTSVAVDDLSDVSASAPNAGDVLKYNGTSWITQSDNGGISLGDISVIQNPPGAAGLSYNGSTGVFNYTPPNLSAYLTTAVTQIDTGAGLSGGPITTTGTLSLSNTGVTAGEYSSPTITVNAQGQITAAANGAAAFPSGGIIMWSGAISTIPSGWYLCDGTNGTPNLTEKFILGVGSDGTGPSIYETIGLESWTSTHYAPILFLQALDDTTGGGNQPTWLQDYVTAVQAVTSNATATLTTVATGGHNAFTTDSTLQGAIRSAVGSDAGGNTIANVEFAIAPSDGQTHTIGNTSYPVMGKLYVPTGLSASQVDVVVLFHGTLLQGGSSTIAEAASDMLERFVGTDTTSANYTNLNVRDKIIFSVAYPQDHIAQDRQFDLAGVGTEQADFLIGDNLPYARAAVGWVKDSLNGYISAQGGTKTIGDVYLFGHSQGGKLVSKINTLDTGIAGVIADAPGPIQFDQTCTAQPGNISCSKVSAIHGAPGAVSGGIEVGATGGSNSVSLSETHLPSHAHDMDPHAHGVGNHTHTVTAHDHTVDNHSHGMGNHTHSMGSHYHSFSGSGSATSSYQSQNHEHAFTTSMAGAHAHLYARSSFGSDHNGEGSGIALCNAEYDAYTAGVGNHNHGGTTVGITRDHTHWTAISVSGNTGNGGGGNTGGTGGTTDQGGAQTTSSNGGGDTSPGGPGVTQPGGTATTKNVGNGTSFNVIPEYYALAFIMKS